MYNYLIENEDYMAISLEIKKIITDNSFNDNTISIYDLDEDSLEKPLEDLDTYSLLSNKKVIIIKNFDALDLDKNSIYIDHLIKYLNNPSSDNLLFIHYRKINNTYKINKEIKKLCKYIDSNINSKNYIKELLKDYNIDQASINLIDEYSLGDITKIYNECYKLMNYKYDDKTITINDVNDIVIKKLGDPKDLTFGFARSIGIKDKKGALKQYRELLDYNIEPYSLIGLLGSQIRIIYQVKILSKKHLNDKEIANMLDEKSDYRIKKTRELIPLYSEEELLRLMQILSDIDLTIKTTDINPNSLIEQFIINLDN